MNILNQIVLWTFDFNIIILPIEAYKITMDMNLIV